MTRTKNHHLRKIKLSTSIYFHQVIEQSYTDTCTHIHKVCPYFLFILAWEMSMTWLVMVRVCVVFCLCYCVVNSNKQQSSCLCLVSFPFLYTQFHAKEKQESFWIKTHQKQLNMIFLKTCSLISSYFFSASYLDFSSLAFSTSHLAFSSFWEHNIYVVN